MKPIQHFTPRIAFLLNCLSLLHVFTASAQSCVQVTKIFNPRFDVFKTPGENEPAARLAPDSPGF